MKKLWPIFLSILLIATFVYAEVEQTSGKPDSGLLGTVKLKWRQAHIKAVQLYDAAAIIFEGATEDAYETTVSVTDPTADNTLTVPNDSGALVFSPGGNATSAADSLAIPITTTYVQKTTGADAEALTLANGENGQILTIDLAVDGGGNATLTPTTKAGFTSIVFEDAGDVATLMYVDDTIGWIILGTAGVAAPPVTVD